MLKRILLLSILSFCSNLFAQNNSLQFNGNGTTGPYVSVSTNSNDFNLGSAFTFEAWVYPTVGSNGFQTILSKGDNNGLIDGGYIFQIQSGILSFYNATAPANPYWYSSGASIPNNTWTHVAVSYSSGSLRFYVNGALVNSFTVTMNLNSGLNDFYIGRQGFGCQCHKFNGQIDEVRVWNIGRTSEQIRDSYLQALTGSESGLVAYYTFNQGLASGNNAAITTLTDFAGTPNTGALVSFGLTGSLSNFVTGVNYLNNALHFDGTNDIIDVPANAKLNVNANPFTVEYWVRPTVVDALVHWVVNKGTGNGSVDYLVGLSSNTKFRFIGRNVAFDLNGATSAVAGNWYHVANVFDGTSARIYVNGVLDGVTTTIGTAANNTSGLRIGARTEFGAPTQYFQGDIDEIRIWNFGLSQQEIIDNRFKNFTATTPGLVAYYDFNQGVPTLSNSTEISLIDRSGNNLNGTLTSFTLSPGTVSNWVRANSTTTLGIFFTLGPTITGISPNMTVCGGTDVNATVSASGSSLSYQWYFQGSPLAGQNNATLTLSSALITSSGSVFVVVSNNGGVLTSSGISLTLGCNNALDFDGSDFVRVPSGFPSLQEITIEAWIFPRVSGGIHRILSYDNSAAGALQFYLTTGGMAFSMSGNTPSEFRFGTFPANNNYHVAVVYSAIQKNVKFYINGVLSFTGNYTTAINSSASTPFQIGSWFSGVNNNFFNGRIDELRVWNTALSDADILANYNKTTNVFYPGLLLNYDFNQGQAGGNNTGLLTVLDKSGNATNGTLNTFGLTGASSNWVASSAPIAGNTLTFSSPNILGLSTSQTVCSGITIPLSVTATGSGLGYQWRKNGVNIVGAVASTLTLTGVTSSSAGIYTVVVTSLGGNLTSSGISLGVGCNNALDFDGVNDNIFIGNLSQLEIGPEFTCEAWVYPRAKTSLNYIFGKQIGGNGPGWSFYQNSFGTSDGKLVLQSNGGNVYQTVDNVIPLNAWSHVALTISKGVPNLYINGVLTPFNGVYLNAPSTRNFRVGASDDPSFYFNGQMDEVRIWNVAVAQADIAGNLFRNVSTTTPGMVLYYDFNQGIPSGINTSITSLLDRSTNGLNGTFVGFGNTGASSNFIASTATITTTSPYVFTPPSIVGLSPSVTVCSGIITTLSVSATGTNLNYQWYKNGTAIAGQTFATLTLSSALTTSAGNIFAVVSNMAGTVTSSGISLGVGCNNALNFDGTNDYVFVGNQASLNFNTTDHFTVQFWFRTTTAAQKAILSKLTNAAPFNGYEVGLFSGKVTLFLCNNFGTSNYINYTSTNAFNDGNWHQATIVYKGNPTISGAEIYVDGVLENNIVTATTLTGSILNSNNLHIGARGNSGFSFLYEGDLEELRVWNVALSTLDIQNNLLKTGSSTLPGLVASYDFNQGLANGPNSGVTSLPDQKLINPGTLNNFGLANSTSNWISSSVPISGVFAFALPTITGISQASTVCSGVTFTMAVTAIGTNLNYQWYKNGTPIAGQTFSTLTLSSGLTTSSGTILAVVSNSIGSVTSSGVTLAVGCNYALDFDGVDDKVNVSFAGTNSPSNQITIETWVYATDITSRNRFEIIRGSGVLLSFDNFGTRLTFGANLGNGPSVTINPADFVNKWVHIAAVADGTNLLLYKDGILLGSAAGTFTNGLSTAAIGSCDITCSPIENFKGSMDEFRIWNRAIAQSDIQANLYRTVSSSLNGIYASFDFNQGVPNGNNAGLLTLLDRSGNGNNATLVNFANSGVTSNWVNSNTTIIGTYVFGAPTISGITSNQTVCTGAPATFTVTASGTITNYQWFRNGTAISGQTNNTITIANVTETSTGNYFVVVSGPTTNITSSGTTLAIGCLTTNSIYFSGTQATQPLSVPQLATTNPAFTVEIWVNPGQGATPFEKYTPFCFHNIGGTTGKFFIQIYDYSGGFQPEMDFSIAYYGQSGLNTTGIKIPRNTWSHVAVSTNPTNNEMNLYVNGSLVATTNTMTYQPNYTSGAQIKMGAQVPGGENMIGSVDGLRLWSGTRSAAQIAANFMSNLPTTTPGLLVSADFDFEPVATQFTNKVNNQTYLLNGATYGPNYSYTPPVTTIRTNPVSQNFCNGDQVSLTVSATGSNLSYQWYKNGVILAGQQSTSLGFSNATATTAGSYFVVVNGIGGVATSTSAVLSAGCNNALDFDGVDDYVAINGGTNLPVADFTIETWVKTSSSGTQVLLGNTNFDGYYLTLASNNKARFLIGADPIVESIGDINDGQWHHLAVTRNGTVLSLYLDGIFQNSSVSVTPLPNVGSTELGRYGTNFYYAGDLDEVRIWDIALSSTEIQANRFRNLTTTTPGLVVYYDFNQGQAGGNNSGLVTLNDKSGTNNQGTLNLFGLNGPTSNWVSASTTTISGSYLFTVPSIVAISPSDTICSGFPPILNVTAAGSALKYQWYKNGSSIPGQNFSSAILPIEYATTPGTYFVTVTNPVGSVTSAGIAISHFSETLLTAQPLSQTICGLGTVYIEVATEDPEAQYIWNTGETTSGINISVPGIYFATVSGQCDVIESDTAFIGVEFPIVGLLASSTSVGLGQQVTLTGFGAATYTIAGGTIQSGVPFSPTVSDFYTVAGTTLNGCVGTGGVFINVTAPVTSIVNTSPSRNVCLRQAFSISVTATGQNLFYDWYKDGALFLSGPNFQNVNFPSANPFNTGLYYVVVTGDNGIATSTGINVSIQSPTVSGIVSQPIVCLGQPTTITGIGASTYTISGGATSGTTFFPSITDTYTISGSDNLGCVGIGIVTVTVLGLPTVDVERSVISVCAGQSVTVGGLGALTYSWTNGIVDRVPFMPVTSGFVTVTGFDANGCSNTKTVNIGIDALPDVSIGSHPSLVCAGQSISLTGAGVGLVSSSWSDGVVNNVPFIPSSTKTYTFTGINAKGCSNVALATITVSPAINIIPITTTSLFYGQSIVDTYSATGTGKITFSTSGTIPNGLTFSTSTGGFSGAADKPSIYTFTVSATNGACSDTKAQTISVLPAPLLVQVLDTSIYGLQPVPTSFVTSVTGLVFGQTIMISTQTTAPANPPFGNYPIIVSVSGTALDNYSLTANPGTLRVLPLIPMTVVASNFQRDYGTINPTLTGTSIGLVPTDRVNFIYSTLATITTPVGTSTITPTITGFDAYKYNVTYAPGVLQILPASLEIEVLDYYLAEGSPFPTKYPTIVTGMLAQDSSKITIDYTVNTSSSTVLGVYTIRPKVSGSPLNNYILTITAGRLYIKYGLTVSGDNFSRTYGQLNPVFTGTILGVKSQAPNVRYSLNSLADPFSFIGNYPINPIITGADVDKYVITTLPGTLSILPAPLTVAARNFLKFQGDPNPTFASDFYGLVNGESVSVLYSTTATQNSPLGTYPIYPAPFGTTLSNYSVTTVAGILTIGSTTSPLVISIGNYSISYGDVEPNYQGVVTGIKAGDDVQVRFTANVNPTTPIGSYPIAIMLSGQDVPKYALTTSAGILTINKANLTVSGDNVSKFYADPVPALTYSTSGLRNNDPISVIVQAAVTNLSDVGSYIVRPSVTGLALSNYNLTVLDGQLNVLKVPLTVLGATISRGYKQNNPTLGFNLIGFVNNENISVIDVLPVGTTIADINAVVGSYPITYSNGVDNNYSFVYTNGTLNVGQSNQTLLVANDTARVRTGDNITLTALINSGLPIQVKVVDTTIIQVESGLRLKGISDGTTKIIISQNGNANYLPAIPVTIIGISTSAGLVPTAVIGIVGESEVVPSNPVTYSMPLKRGYTYLWTYTGKNLNWNGSDSTKNEVVVIFMPTTTQGQMIGKMFDPDGNLVKADTVPVVFNLEPQAQTAAYLAQQLTKVKCEPVVTNCTEAYILDFNLGKRIRNATNCSKSGFGDYTRSGKIDTLIMGGSYILKATASNKKTQASYFAIWIDYGNDGSFEDPDDFIRASFKADTIFEVNNVIIRNNDLYQGPRRVRISMRTSGQFVRNQSCPEEGTVGETEDYLIYIRQPDALEAPSILTPNGDGKNDLFSIRGINLKADSRKLSILDRWGRLVYAADSYENDWGGTDKNGNLLEDGTYFYFFQNGAVQIKGYLEIKTK